jgi:hypothetical protein
MAVEGEQDRTDADGGKCVGRSRQCHHHPRLRHWRWHRRSRTQNDVVCAVGKTVRFCHSPVVRRFAGAT